ncbi:helix-turn-helix transcriptional regulator [uncultured Anaerovibrio sp.]|uniref:helix-turn-helix domain-containing protein n=1 Tax=uncultured Anaerovibrio sp. TaxID=361586 RepID=UPI0025F52770|nr:helix-turn-helix transcriptional regulator [uncultured Anaerovibrio sp.]
MKNNHISIGDQIVELRQTHKIQQGELAKAINIHQSVLNRIEKGLRPARDEEIRDIAIYFDISADTLLSIPHQNSIATFELSNDEISMLQKFRELDDRGREAVVSTITREYRYVK